MNAIALPSHRIWIPALLIACSIVALPFVIQSASAAGEPTLMVSAPAASIPGASALVTGNGFAANEAVFLTFGTQTASVTADDSGGFTTSLPIPTVPASLQFVSAFGESSGTWAIGYLWVAGFSPQVVPTSYYLLPGNNLGFTGTGFGPHETVTARYGATVVGTFTTDGDGRFSDLAAPFPPSLRNTTATVDFLGESSGAATSIALTIGQLYPSLAPSTWYTGAGSVIALSGSGFAPHESVAVAAGTATASSTADGFGAWTLDAFPLPSTGGSLTLVATGGESGASAAANIFLSSPSPWLTFSSYWGQGGSPLTIFGNSFLPNEQVTLSSGAAEIGTATADGAGGFSFAGAIPFAPAGPVSIVGTGSSSGAVASAPLTVAPVYTDLQLVSYAGAPGDAVHFVGHGYLPNEEIAITTDRTGATVVATFTTDSGGNFLGSYPVPANETPGPLLFTATGAHSFDAKSISYYVTGG